MFIKTVAVLGRNSERERRGAGGEKERQTDRQTDRQAGRQTHR